jgi:putative MATE family efflux protein
LKEKKMNATKNQITENISLDQRPNPLLSGPVLRPMVKLALPILVVLAIQTLVGVAETYFVSSLGTDAIVGVALVFPLLMLMTMMSNGAIGGGVSSAIARAIGANRRQDADALVTHSVLLAIFFGAVFTLGAFVTGEYLFRRMGAEGQALQLALQYAYLVFGVAIPTWITNLLAAALRGAGNVRVPAIITVAGAVITLALSPPLILGLGPFPRLGVAGAGLAVVFYYVLSTLALLIYLRSDNAPVRLVATRLQWRYFADVLRVGLPSAVGTLATNLTIVLTTAFVGHFGTAAIAGYGLASRLDYLLIPLLFAIGTAAVTMVGTNVGAGQFHRARRVAWISAALSAVLTGSIGLLAALFPAAWLGLFSHDPAVLDVGVQYLHRVAPFYVVYGIGMALYFSCQGAGYMLWPFMAGIGRLLGVVALGSYWINSVNGSIAGLFWIASACMSFFGVAIVLAFVSGRAWRSKENDTTSKASAPCTVRNTLAAVSNY